MSHPVQMSTSFSSYMAGRKRRWPSGWSALSAAIRARTLSASTYSPITSSPSSGGATPRLSLCGRAASARAASPAHEPSPSASAWSPKRSFALDRRDRKSNRRRDRRVRRWGWTSAPGCRYSARRGSIGPRADCRTTREAHDGEAAWAPLRHPIETAPWPTQSREFVRGRTRRNRDANHSIRRHTARINWLTLRVTKRQPSGVSLGPQPY
jgi:hypothetical protein